MSKVILNQKAFVPFISEAKVSAAVARLGAEINVDYKGKSLVVIGILDGVFMFMSDLVKHFSVDVYIDLIRLKSYEGTHSSGEVKQTMPLTVDIEGKDVLIVEDIVDTGNTMSYLIPELQALNPASLEVASLLVKPDVFQNKFPIKYLGIEIANKFVVGYGMDYDGYGRQLPEIYVAED